jgi:hypothetical protein
MNKKFIWPPWYPTWYTHYIATSVVRLVYEIGKSWYKDVYKHIMYVISLSNISIKTNYKQITTVELKLTNLYNTLKRLYFVHDVTLVVAVHSPRSRYCLIIFSVTVQSSDNTFLEKCGPYSCRKYWNYVFGNENMTVNIFTIHNTNEWTLNDRFVQVAYIDMVSPHSSDKTSWQSSSAEKIACNSAPIFYHQSVAIQHLVSDTLYQTGYFLYFQRKT